jgi:5-epi-alpha-selinene synthase
MMRSQCPKAGDPLGFHEWDGSTTTRRLEVPALWCPVPSARHVAADAIEEGTITWMKRHGFIENASQEAEARIARFGIRAAHVHPVGWVDAIQLVSDLTVWLFLADDVYVESPGSDNRLLITTEHAIRSLRVLRDPDELPAEPDAALLALQDISRRLRTLATPEQVDRVVHGMVEFFLAGCCEAIHFARRSLPGVADYVPVRDAINCLRCVCFVFIEMVGRFELPGPVWCRPDLQLLVRKATRIVSNHHDLLSGLRELAHEVPMNLPAVMTREFGMPTEIAFKRVAELANADMRVFLRLAEDLLARESNASVRCYVDGLKSWIRGNLDWSLTTGRYRVADLLGVSDEEALSLARAA